MGVHVADTGVPRCEERRAKIKKWNRENETGRKCQQDSAIATNGNNIELNGDKLRYISQHQQVQWVCSSPFYFMLVVQEL